MTERTAVIGRVLGPSAPESQSVASSHGLNPTFALDANMYRPPDYYIYLYTTSDRDFNVSQPPLVPRWHIAARVKGERCSLIGKIPHPFQQVDREGGNGEVLVRAHSADRVAMSLLNPNNPTLDQNFQPDSKSVLGLGNNLSVQGLFWSRNNPPTEEEIQAAVVRKEKYYTDLLEKARTLEISNPKELELLINRDYHMAAEYFNRETGWHKKVFRLEECPLCGEQIKPGIAAHKNELGGTCILDEARAKKMGLLPTTSPSERS